STPACSASPRTVFICANAWISSATISAESFRCPRSARRREIAPSEGSLSSCLVVSPSHCPCRRTLPILPRQRHVLLRPVFNVRLLFARKQAHDFRRRSQPQRAGGNLLASRDERAGADDR